MKQIIQPTIPLQKFLDSKDEKILLWQRTHWIFPLWSCLVTLFTGIVFMLSSVVCLERFIQSSSFFIAYGYCICCFLFIIFSNIVVNWYFHFYLVTTNKIMEVRYSPFFAYKTNCVLLNQVHVTEIDNNRFGILKELFDYGNITVTFDRPTHEDEFTFTNIAHPVHLANRLQQYFSLTFSDDQIWYSHTQRRGFRYART